jgi:hypothetical protein
MVHSARFRCRGVQDRNDTRIRAHGGEANGRIERAVQCRASVRDGRNAPASGKMSTKRTKGHNRATPLVEQPKPGPEGGCLAESGSFESCGHYRKGGTHARIERLKLPPGSLRASVRSMNRSVSEHPWTQQNRARIGFAVFPLSAPPEPRSPGRAQSKIARTCADFERFSERSENLRTGWWSRRDLNPRPPRCERGASDARR